MSRDPDYQKLQRLRAATLSRVEGGKESHAYQILETSSRGPAQGSLLPPLDPQEDYYTNPVIQDFQSLATNSYDDRERLSNMFVDWELIPRYNGAKLAGVSAKGSQAPLPIISHHCDTQYDVKMVLTPAQLKEKGSETEQAKFYYPGETEKLVEWALVKMATESAECVEKIGTGGSSEYGVSFSLSGLRNMMYSYQRGRSYKELVRALEIMNRCHLEVVVGGKATAQGAILTSLKTYSDNAYKKNSPNSRWQATFHPLINFSIENRSYRQYNLERLMTTRTNAASELCKMILTRGRNISKTIPFKKSYREFSEGTGLLKTKRRSDGIRAFKQMISSLIDDGTLDRVEYKEIRGKRNRVEDIEASLYGSNALISEIKAGHYRENQLSKKGQSELLLTER